MPRKQRDTSKKREAILDAAIEAFCSEGYDNASMDRIAEIAGASKRTVYNHFASKELLFEAVFARFVDETRALKDVPYVPGKSLESQLASFVNAKLAIFKNPAWLGLTKVAMTMLIQDSQLARRSLERYQQGEDSLEAWLIAAVGDGQLLISDTKLASSLFWSMVSGALVWPQLMSGTFPKRRVSALKKEVIVTFLARHQAA